jgi:hypothetical protein
MSSAYPVDAAVIPIEEDMLDRANPAGLRVEFLLENPRVCELMDNPPVAEIPIVVAELKLMLFAETKAVPPVDP